jgi:hypothetical protein
MLGRLIRDGLLKLGFLLVLGCVPVSQAALCVETLNLRSHLYDMGAGFPSTQILHSFRTWSHDLVQPLGSKHVHHVTRIGQREGEPPHPKEFWPDEFDAILNFVQVLEFAQRDQKSSACICCRKFPVLHELDDINDIAGSDVDHNVGKKFWTAF